MSNRTRLIALSLAAVAIGTLFVFAVLELPSFGQAHHPYRDLAVAASVRHATANVVSSINFDQRGFDTLIEETILLGSVAGVAGLLRPTPGEEELQVPEVGRVLDSTALLGYVMLPVTLIVGFDLVLHGALTPGGGFQGGVVLGTAIHLLYVAGSFRALEKIRPMSIYQVLDAAAAASFTVFAIIGVAVGGSFLVNFLPFGGFGHFFSSGLVPVLNGLVGIEVLSAVILLLASFLDQEILVRTRQ